LKSLDIVHEPLHQEKSAAVFLLEMLGRGWIGSVFVEVEPGTFVYDIEYDLIVADNCANANLLVLCFPIAAKDRVRNRLSESDADIERAFMGWQMKLATLSRRELHYVIDVAYVARYLDIESDV